jgi:hypothetical protein
MDSAKRQVVDEDGHVRTGRAAVLALAAAGAVGFLVWRNSR